MARSTKPWDKPNPRKKAGKPSKKLSPSKKASAKASAKRAGRKYPSLVDNMRAASKKTSKKSSSKKSGTKKSRTKKKTTAKKRTTKKRSTKKASKKARKGISARTRTGAATKDPKGGLTAAGRAAFAKSQGAHLKPGVMRHGSAMSAEDMRRKGSWATRFYGRHPLPPLVGKNGKPTRLALSAHAWGEPVPKTEAAARKIAAKGQRLLERYKKLKEGGRAKRP